MRKQARVMVAIGMMAVGLAVPVGTCVEICWRNWRWIGEVGPGMWWAALLAAGGLWLAVEAMGEAG